MTAEARTLRVLVVDDSAFNRRTIGDLLAAIPGVDVVGKAADGEEALRLVLQLRPDLVTLDLEMPKMDGFTFLRLVMARQPTPILVVSGRGAKADVFKALELGALDFIVKPSPTVSTELGTIRRELEEKVAMVRMLKPLDHGAIQPPARNDTATQLIRLPRADGARPAPEDPTPRRVVVIGSSTGGPPALVEVFSRLPSDFGSTVVIAQHMPERFTKTFADRLERLGGIRVAELEEREPLRAGRALVCPGGRCVEVQHKAGTTYAQALGPAPDDRYVPSVDRLFKSAANVYGPRCVGVILTGMGDDGTRGAEAIKKAGGIVIAESQETAAIWGMPGSAERAGVVDRSVPLHGIADAILRACGERRGA
ncbi:chemotaxis-specific protein-glutamate methyltransferase CheB [Sandaracinus amylolyticus]|uniref:Protein-glutamate methylesterase/protein-glutamine glutaminase n=1 Tax=Sandaracinus amylolyticus TaxID=927083 RepID=A0A0F6SGE7_9BACT|nr:chemotaxis-specific protein-glutamate methyltransferase CheB [Sandaracinus amylolyticus]AKF08564.1 Chemotaxis response regulator protein-glutamate methylesterase CheB [Sandaracinus amylolyticus]